MRRLAFAGILFLLTAPAVWSADDIDDEFILMVEVAGASEGIVEIELLPDIAPEHVARVKRLAREGYYNNIVFHRVIEAFMAQTGDVKHGKLENFIQRYAGQGGSVYPDLAAEFSQTPFDRGVVAMARRVADDGSANSQFFIMFAPIYDLNIQYSVFGRVLTGMDVVDRLKKGDPDQNGSVTDPDYMKRVWIKADN